MKQTYNYKVALRLNMLDPKMRLLHKLNAFAFSSIGITCVVGLVLNYCLRMLGEPGGMYLVYAVCGFVLCLIYPYVHEFAHAFAIILVKGKIPDVKFNRLAAYCGSSDIIFSKAQYYFVASFPFVFYNLALIPLCILLPPIFFPLPFMPLMYNVFGSTADWFMIHIARGTARHGIIVDSGTEIVTYVPVAADKIK